MAEMSPTYVVRRGAADYGTRGLYDPPIGFPCSFFVLLFVCCARAIGDGTRHERVAG